MLMWAGTYIHKYDRVGRAKAKVLLLCLVLIERTCQGSEGIQEGLEGQDQDF